MIASSLGLLIAASPARAGAQSHARFEPTDLEMEKPGVMEIDLQSGAMFNRRARLSRVVASDFEVDLGLSKRVEVDVDGAFSYDKANSAGWIGEPLWVSAKLGLASSGVRRDDAGPSASSFALGLQLGLRLPTVHAGSGIGYQAVLLAGLERDRLHLVLNAGGLIDPGDAIGHGRPVQALLGASMQLDVSAEGDWALLGLAATTLSFSDDPHEYYGAIGLQYSPSDDLDISLLALGGSYANGDTFGALLRIAPKLHLW